MSQEATTPDAQLMRTALNAFHHAHGAHMVPFNGWEMPLYYTGILDEHAGVRSGVGLFDVSHMGILTVSGDHAGDLLSRRTTTNTSKMASGQVRYGFWLNSDGHILDDLLVTRLDDGTQGPPRFLVVPNAGRAASIFDLLQQHRRPDTLVARHNPAIAILAVQGPRAREVLEKIFGWSLAGLKFYTAAAFPAHAGGSPRTGKLGVHFPEELGEFIQVSRTGYTGELGYELFVRAEKAPALAEELLRHGARPAGLGCRDTLRLEKGYLLSGSDFSLDRTPIEAGQERFLDLDHPFVGAEVLQAQHTSGPAVKLTGIEVRERGAIPRHGTPLFRGTTQVATLTSGGISPTLGYGIGLTYLPPELQAPGTELTVLLRGAQVPAQVAALPFLRSGPAKPSPS
jgi:aminomethyltransferase